MGSGVYDWGDIQGQTGVSRHLDHQSDVTHTRVDRPTPLILNPLPKSKRHLSHPLTNPHKEAKQEIIHPRHPLIGPITNEQMPLIRPIKAHNHLIDNQASLSKVVLLQKGPHNLKKEN